MIADSRCNWRLRGGLSARWPLVDVWPENWLSALDYESYKNENRIADERYPRNRKGHAAQHQGNRIDVSEVQRRVYRDKQ
jgi:hypothetical protein